MDGLITEVDPVYSDAHFRLSMCICLMHTQSLFLCLISVSPFFLLRLISILSSNILLGLKAGLDASGYKQLWEQHAGRQLGQAGKILHYQGFPGLLQFGRNYQNYQKAILTAFQAGTDDLKGTVLVSNDRTCLFRLRLYILPFYSGYYVHPYSIFPPKIGFTTFLERNFKQFPFSIF
jgi:hypothetical protein